MKFSVIESLKSLSVYASVGFATNTSQIINIWRAPFKLEVTASDYQLTLSEFPEISDSLTLSKDWCLQRSKGGDVSTCKTTTYILSFLGYDLLAFSFNEYRPDKDVEVHILKAISDRTII